jgi:glycine cleavage system H lipoate-binding protein
MKSGGLARIGLTKYHLKYLGDIIYLKFSDVKREAGEGGKIFLIERPDM